MTIPEIENELGKKQEQIEDLRMQLHSTVKNLGELRDQLGLERPETRAETAIDNPRVFRR